MKRKGLVMIMLLMAALMLMSCSLGINGNLDIGKNTDGVILAKFEKSNLSSPEFALDGTSVTSDRVSTILSAEDEVWVTVRLGEGIVEGYLDSSSSVADFLLSAEGEALVSSFKAQQNEIIASIAQADISAEIKYNYTVLQNGFSAKIKYGDIAKIEAIPGVERVVVSERYAIPETDMEAISKAFASTGIFENDSDYSGKGTVIAIIDTGVDVEHSAFSAMPNVTALKRSDVEELLPVTNAFARSATLTIDDVFYSDKVPFGFNYADHDTQYNPDLSDAAFYGHYHGTHVAGIAAGNDDTIRGAAYDAQLAVMRVFGMESTGAYDIDIYAALEDCIVLGVDVANLSLGSSCGFVEVNGDDAEYVSKVLTLAERTGLTICCATGNDGCAWYFSDTLQPFNTTDDPDNGVVSAPASYDGTFAVGSVENFIQIYVELNGVRLIGRNTSLSAEGSDKNDFFDILGDKDEDVFEYVIVPGVGAPEDYSGIDVSGKIAVVKRGELSFTEKVTNAADKGAIGCIIYDNVEEAIASFGAIVEEERIPSFVVTLSDGQKLVKASEKKISVAKDNYYISYSVYSSMGVLDDLSLGVDILGVGGEVYSAVNFWYSIVYGTDNYDYLSGTSMATPNVAGVMATLKGYLKEKYPEKTGAQIATLAQQRLMSTANQLENEEGNPITPRRQGAGLADLAKAMNTDAYLTVTGSDKTKLTLGHDPDKDGIYTLYYNLVNDGDKALSYIIDTSVFTETAVNAYSQYYTTKGEDVNLIDEMAYMLSDASIKYVVDGKTLEGDEITVEAGSTVRIKVVIRLTDEDKAYMDETFANGIYVEGFSTLTSLNDDGIDLAIPYVAFYGDWNDLPVFEPLPWEGAATWGNYMGLGLIKWYDTGSGWYDGTSFLAGAYQYMTPEGYKTPETTADKSVIGLGVNSDGSFASTLILNTFTIAIKRNATKIYLDIVRADTGEVIGHDVFENIPKACSVNNGGVSLTFNGLYPAEAMLANNEKLIFSFTYDFNGVSVGQTVEMPLYVDLEAPTLNKAEWRREGDKLYLDLNVFDNHYLQATGLLTYGTETSYASLYKFMYPVYNNVRNGDNAYSIDMTQHMADIVNGTFAVQLVDYAGNESIYNIELPEEYRTEATSVNGFIKTERQLAVKYSTGSMTVYYDVNDPTYIEVRSAYNSNMLESGNDFAVVNDESDEEFVIEEGTLTTYNGAGGEVIVPDGVKVIGQLVFYNDPNITKIVLPEGVTEIGAGSIYKLANLAELVLPSTLKIINNNSISCLPKLTELNLEDTNVSQVYGMMALTSIKELKFPDADEPLTMSFAVGICYKLEKISFLGDVKLLSSAIIFNDALREIEFFGKVETIDNANSGFGMSLTSLDKLERIVFHEDVGSIGFTTMDDWGGWISYDHSNSMSTLQSLKEVVFEKNVEYIGGFSFASCPKLTNVRFGGSIGEIGDAVCGNSNLLVHGYDVLEGNTYLIKDESGMVYNADKTVMYMPSAWDYDGILELPESITSLKERQFSVPTMIPVHSKQDYGMNDDLSYYWSLGGMASSPDTEKSLLKGVKLGSQITELPDYCFYRNKSLESINLENITNYGDYCLGGTAITELVFGENVTYIGSGVFANCSKLEKLELNEDAAYGGFSSFYAGTALTEIIVPEFITEIGNSMFNNCQKLERVEFLYHGVENIPYGAFANTPNLKEVIGIENVVTTEGSVFSQSGITSISLPKLTTMGYYSFYYCESLASAEFESLEVFGSSWGESCQFAGCVSLKEFNIPAKLQAFDVANVFSGCTALEAINVHEDNTTYASVDGILFDKNMTNIIMYPAASENVEFEVPETISVIGDGVFQNTKHLTKVIMPSVESIGSSAFVGSAIEEVVVSEKLYTINSDAFNGTPLESIDLSNVVEIDDGAFANTKLAEIVLNKLEYIGNRVFEGVDVKKITLGRVEEFNFSRAFYGVANAEIVLDDCESFVIDNNALYNAFKTILYRYLGNESDVVLSEGLVKIESEAFKSLKTLVSIELPSTLAYIGDAAFYGCSSLEEITFKSEKAPVLENYYRENARYLYNQFVNDIDAADGNASITVYHGADASYDTFIWRFYFKNREVR